MTTEDLPQEPKARLLEVLLDETFRQPGAMSPRTPATRHGSRWLAAAIVVLGLGVVVGVMQMRWADQPALVPAQDPKFHKALFFDPNTVFPLRHADFVARIDEVQRVSLQLVHPAAEGKGLVSVEAAVATLDDAERLRAFLAKVPVCGDGTVRFEPPPDFSAYLTFELRGGQQLVAFVRFDDRPLFQLAMLMPKELDAGPFLTTLNELHVQAITKARTAQGITHSLDELQEVPATAKAILCRPLQPGTVARHLGRFTQLERLELAFQTSLGSGGPVAIEMPAPIRLAEFASLTRLRHLRFPGNGITDTDVEELARLPVLTSVRIDGGLGDLTDAGRRALVRRLESIELVDVADPDSVLQAVLDAGITRRVALRCRSLRRETFASLVTMPTLADLELSGEWCSDEHLVLLAKTKLERLTLQGTKVTATGLASLASIHTLRELDMRRHPLDEAVAAALTKAMPQCRIRRPGEVAPPATVAPREARATGK